MIHFKSYLVAQAEKVIMESHDMAETANDLYRIKSAINTISSPNGLLVARQIDTEMRKKHPMIDEMLRIADLMPHYTNIVQVPNPNANVQVDTVEYKALMQDKYGILCEALIKKGYTRSVEHFIEKVEK